MKISWKVSKLWSGHQKLTDGQTDGHPDRRMDGRKAQHNTTRLWQAYKKNNQYERSFVLENMKS